MAGERKQRQTEEEVGGCLGNILEVVRRRKILSLNLLIGPFSLEKLWMDIGLVILGLAKWVGCWWKGPPWVSESSFIKDRGGCISFPKYISSFVNYYSGL